MDGHIDELAAGSRSERKIAVECGPGILRVAADKDNFADVAVINLLLGDTIGFIKTAHEAEHKYLIGMSLDDLFCNEALLNVLSQRLLAEDMLAGFHSDADHVHMGSGVGEDGNCLHFGICAHGRRIGVDLLNIQFVRDFFCARGIAVADRDQFHTGNTVCDIASMLITKTSDTDNTHLKLFHDFSPFNSC